MRELEDCDYRGTQAAKMGDGSHWFRIPRIPKQAKVYDLLSKYSHIVTKENTESSIMTAGFLAGIRIGNFLNLYPTNGENWAIS
jgi:hypothetical protein